MRLFRRSSGENGRWIVVGLGNPGPDYAGTRHNVGAMVLDELLGRTSASLRSHKSGCLIAEVRLVDHRVVLARSTSYMNDSGRPVGALVRFYKTPIEQVVVVHDELDVRLGEVRLKSGGGTAGHNGLKSLVAHLGKDFARVRVGISRPRGRQDPVDYVLDDFGKAEREELPFVLGRAADAVERVIEVGIERAMNEFNTRTADS